MAFDSDIVRLRNRWANCSGSKYYRSSNLTKSSHSNINISIVHLEEYRRTNDFQMRFHFRRRTTQRRWKTVVQRRQRLQRCHANFVVDVVKTFQQNWKQAMISLHERLLSRSETWTVRLTRIFFRNIFQKYFWRVFQKYFLVLSLWLD